MPLRLAVALVTALAGPVTEHDPASRANANASADTVPATVEAIAGSSALVGRVVRVSGVCLPPRAARPIGPPPRTRGDWQLAADSAAVYVTGPMPAECGREGAVTIVARVAEYTHPMRGSPAGVRKRYLVMVR